MQQPQVAGPAQGERRPSSPAGRGPTSRATGSCSRAKRQPLEDCQMAASVTMINRRLIAARVPLPTRLARGPGWPEAPGITSGSRRMCRNERGKWIRTKAIISPLSHFLSGRGPIVAPGRRGRSMGRVRRSPVAGRSRRNWWLQLAGPVAATSEAATPTKCFPFPLPLGRTRKELMIYAYCRPRFGRPMGRQQMESKSQER